MATIIRTLEEQGHWEGATEGHWIEASGPKGKRQWVPGDSAHWVSEGWVPVKDQVVTQGTTSVRRGALTQRTVEAWQSGRGRRNRSPYQVKAMASGRGVLAPAGIQFTREMPADRDYRTGINPYGPRRNGTA